MNSAFSRNPFSRNAAFTLIELMVVVAIVAILAAIAYPSYLDQVRKSRRADAESVLMQAAQFMERYYTENNCYKNPGANNLCEAGDADPALPFSKSPIDGNDQYYAVSLTAVGTATFTVSAVPAGDQASEKCGTLTLTNTGAKGQSGGTLDECW